MQNADVLTDSLLAEILVDDPDILTEKQKKEIRTGIQRGLDDFAAGRTQSVAKWAAKLRQDFHLPTQLSNDELSQEETEP